MDKNKIKEIDLEKKQRILLLNTVRSISIGTRLNVAQLNPQALENFKNSVIKEIKSSGKRSIRQKVEKIEEFLEKETNIVTYNSKDYYYIDFSNLIDDEKLEILNALVSEFVFEEKEKQLELERILKSSLWKIYPQRPDIIHRILREKLPIIKAVKYMEYLLGIKFIEENKDFTDFLIIKSFFGYKHIIFKINTENNNYLFSIGNWWDINDFENKLFPYIEIESYLKDKINKLAYSYEKSFDSEELVSIVSSIDFYEINRIDYILDLKDNIEGMLHSIIRDVIEEEKRIKKIENQIYTWKNLLSLLLFHFTEFQENVLADFIKLKKKELKEEVIKEILEKNFQKESPGIFKYFPFKYDSKEINSLYNEILGILDNRETKLNKFKNFSIKVYFPVSYNMENMNIAVLGSNIKVSMEGENIENTITIEKPKSREKTEAINDLKIETKSLDKEDSDYIKETIKKSFFEFLKKETSYESEYTKLLYKIMHSKLQSIHFAEFETISFNIIKSACNLVLGHSASFFRYKSIDDYLEPTAMYRIRIFQKEKREDEKKAVIKAKEELSEKIKNWSKNKKSREESSSYRALDNNCVVSSFKGKNSDCSIFSERYEKEIQTIDVAEDWFIKEKDIIAIPVSYHGRKLGVIHVASVFPQYFTYREKNILVDFIQNFKSEIFEALLLDHIRKINESLEEIMITYPQGINTKEEEDKFRNDEIKFYKKLATTIAELLGANGCEIFWKKESGDGYEPLASVGVTEQVYINKLNKKEISTVKSSYEENEIKNIISIPLKGKYETLGFIILFDKYESGLTEVIKDDLELIGKYLLTVLNYYFEHKSKVSDIQLIVGHEISSQIRGIHLAIKRLSHKIDEENISFDKFKDLFKKIKKEELETYIETARRLSEYISGQGRLPTRETIASDPLLGYFTYLGLYKRDNKSFPFEYLDIYQLINSNLNATLPLFDEKNIRFYIKKSLMNFPKIYFSRILMNQLIKNIIDNAAKYTKKGTSVKVYYIEEPTRYIIVFSNFTDKLIKDEYARNPNILTKKYIRGFSESVAKEGLGRGLFIASEIAKNFGGKIHISYKAINEKKAIFRVCISIPKQLIELKEKYYE